jgi:DNA polymerase-3 subunit gamma/tau
MLLKALEEVAQAPNAMMAAEMAVIRLTHVADLPSPEDLVRRLQDAPPPPAPAPGGGGGAAPAGGGYAPAPRGPSGGRSGGGGQGGGGGATALAVAPSGEAALAPFPTFAQVVALLRARRDMRLLVEVETGLRLARYAPGRIEFVPAEAAPADLAPRLAQRLQAWTGVRWGVSVVNEGGGPTIAESQGAEQDSLHAEVRSHPLVQAALAAFPGAEIREVRLPEAPAAASALAPAPEDDDMDDDWDPFEEG